ncbi:MAG TPA: YHS domain-containing protein [Candidatus Eisenbacteria bacterium]|nr:YHS domain-containing protein [Candidatus Eisenbacteria bacterium]
MDEPQGETAVDPVCGMTVDIERATADGRTAEHNGSTYYFCGKGCLLDFRDDPEKYFDPTYRPSM